MQVSWEEDPGISPHGMLTYFFEFLHVSGLWEDFVEQCPLRYTSPNAPTKAEILGTILCGVLGGHRRYAHISGMRGDPVLPRLLGIGRLRSEDSIRRAFTHQDEDALTLRMDQQTDKTFAAMLEQEWVLDLDATVKTLYGRQEEARLGYNPMKPGRPSHVYQVLVLAAAKLVLNADVQAGNLTASEYAQPTLWVWLESRERKDWPTFLRGDIAHGNEKMMSGAEERGVPYLFKLRQTKGVAQFIARLATRGAKAGWRDAGQGWEDVESHLQLQGWSRTRRVIVLRRKLRERPEPVEDTTQLRLPGCALQHNGGEWFEHVVLVTSWEEKELLAVAQAYRDRADTENMFVEVGSASESITVTAEEPILNTAGADIGQVVQKTYVDRITVNTRRNPTNMVHLTPGVSTDQREASYTDNSQLDSPRRSVLSSEFGPAAGRVEAPAARARGTAGRKPFVSSRAAISPEGGVAPAGDYRARRAAAGVPSCVEEPCVRQR